MIDADLGNAHDKILLRLLVGQLKHRNQEESSDRFLFPHFCCSFAPMPTETLSALGKSAGMLAIAVVLFAGGFATGKYAPVSEKAEEKEVAVSNSLSLATTTATSTPKVATTNTPVKKAVAKAAPAPAPVASAPLNYTGTSGAWAGTIISGLYSPFLEFVRSDFDRAVREGKLAVLFFYDSENGDAIELIRLTNAFAKRTAGGVVGFKVDFGAQADPAEREIATYYSVEKTNTKVLIRNGIILLKTPDVWNEARIAKEIEEQW